MSFFWHQLSFCLGFHNRSLARFPVHLGNLNIVTPASICYNAKIKGDSYFFEPDEMVSTIWILEHPTEEIHFQKEIEPLLRDSSYEVIYVAAREVLSSGSRQPLEAWLEARDIKFETDDLERLPSTRGCAPRALRLPECLLLGSINGRYEMLAGETVCLIDLEDVTLAQGTLERITEDAVKLGFGSPETRGEWQIVGKIRARKITDTALELRVKLSPLERRIVFETSEHSVKTDAGLLTMILSKGGEGKLELWDGRIPLAARFETRAEYTALVKNISHELELLDWMPGLKIQTDSSDEGYLHIKLPFVKDFLDWFYRF